MNIRDVKDPEFKVKDGDLLQMIIDQQHLLMRKYEEIERKKGIDSHSPVNVHTCRGQQRLKDIMWRVVEEIGEASNCLKNKPWKVHEVPTDVDHYQEELSDALHFFIELLITSGIDSADRVAALYYRKAKVNEFRQRSQY